MTASHPPSDELNKEGNVRNESVKEKTPKKDTKSSQGKPQHQLQAQSSQQQRAATPKTQKTVATKLSGDNAEEKEDAVKERPLQKSDTEKNSKEGTTETTKPPPRKKSDVKEPPKEHSTKPHLLFDDSTSRKKAIKKQILDLKPTQKQVALFSHLPQYERPSSESLTLRVLKNQTSPVSSTAPTTASEVTLHPDIVRLGLMYADRLITGANARCVAMLTAFRKVIEDYKTPAQKSLALDLDSKLKPLIQYLTDCRPLALGMRNAIKHLKVQIGKTTQMSEDEAKDFLLNEIDRYLQERIVAADQLIATFAVSKINDGDVILTYARSHVIELTLKKAFDEGKNFKVIVVDSRPKFEGKVLLKRLVRHGIRCTYVLLNAISYILKEVSKVMVGAHALLSNGAVYSRVGTAVVCHMAHASHVPVIVCSETYKFCERVQLDSICFNELDDPDYLNTTNREGISHLKQWKENPHLKLLNLVYDVTPSENVTMVITEVGMIPPTSVPVVIREYRKDLPL